MTTHTNTNVYVSPLLQVDMDMELTDKVTCIYCPFQTMFARAVWVENGKEIEGTLPNNWININNKTVK